ncbi:MAG: ABC transporter ATP-binding protein [Acidobacteriales bacterium]|nr:ABC transporter ATP-binding protein [Terriglobales bacterium]
MAVIEIQNLRKTYKTGFWRKTEKEGLKGISFEVREGEVFGCLGPNGAGKTTTLKILMGLIFPSGGTARILGMDIHDPRVKQQIGFLPEQPYLYDYLTPLELLEYYAGLSGVPARERRKRSEAALARAGMSEAANMPMRKCSKGMLQRVGIAQAIVHDPKVVFLDEPMSGLDPIGRREVRELIQSLHDEGKTVFFSTHILTDAEAICDRVAVLDRGELKGVDVVADLLSKARGKVEITWQGQPKIESIRAMSLDYHATGESVRAVVKEADTDRVVDAVRQAGARLVSVTPVHGALEEYFLAKVDAPKKEAEE